MSWILILGSLAAFTAGTLLAKKRGALPKLWLNKSGTRVQPRS